MIKEDGSFRGPEVSGRKGLQGGDAMRVSWADLDWREWKTRVDMAGRIPSDETRKKISDAKKGVRRGQQFSEEMSLLYGGIKVIAGPLLLRGGLLSEISHISGFEEKKVGYLRDNMRKRGDLPKPTAEEESQRKREAHSGKPRASKGRVYTEEQLAGFAFLQAFAQDRLFADISSWHEMQDFYAARKREVPQDFAIKLRMELFFKALQRVMETGDTELLDRYEQAGQAIHAWFTNAAILLEERFLYMAITGRKRYDLVPHLDRPKFVDRRLKKPEKPENIPVLDLHMHDKVKNADGQEGVVAGEEIIDGKPYVRVRFEKVDHLVRKDLTGLKFTKLRED